MKIFLVTYSLKARGRDYTKLYDTLKSGIGWCRYLDSTWFLSVQDSDSADVWRDKLKATMDESDLIFIVDMSNSAYSGWLPKEAWDWFSKSKATK